MTLRDGKLGEIPIGEQLGFLEYLVTSEKLSMFRESVGYSGASFPNIVVKEGLEVLLRKCEIGLMDSVTHTDRYYRPPVTDRRVQVTGWIRGRRQDRGAELLLVDTFAVDEIGTEILRSQHTFRLSVSRAAERLGRRPSVSRRRPGAEFLTPVEKRVTEETIDGFEAARRAILDGADAGARFRSAVAHASAELASGMGLAGVVAPVELGLAYLHELLDRRFGIDFRQGGTLTVNYRRPMYAGDTLQARGLVMEQEPEGGRERFRVQVWLENGRGEPVVTGEARIIAPSPLT